jgi:hypothetical protein
MRWEVCSDGEGVHDIYTTADPAVEGELWRLYSGVA